VDPRDEEIARLRAENAELRALVETLQKRIEELERQIGSGGPPPFVKANKPPRETKERKKRNLHFCRRRDPSPTDIAIHVPETCPDCGHRLSGGWEHRRRQVIEIEPSPVKITDHVVIARHCGVCGKRVIAPVDLSDLVVGKHRVGVTLMSWIAYLHIVARIPLRTIKRLLKLMFGLDLGLGELSEVLHTIANHGTGAYEQLRNEIRGSPVVNGDETGWREDGQNGYLWLGATPKVRVFLYDKSRAGAVAEEFLGENKDRVLVSDFYGGYNGVLGPKQRCWVHLLRDLHKKLRVPFPDDIALGQWIDAVKALYEEALAYQRQCLEGKALNIGLYDRKRKRREFEQRLLALAQPYAAKDSTAPQKILAQRMVNFVEELFTFVQYPEVPSHNNDAERAIRPAVIGRKISGGTRSQKGTKTKTVLMSLFATWQLQGLNPVQNCCNLLLEPQQ